jgi:hypothetical protein
VETEVSQNRSQFLVRSCELPIRESGAAGLVVKFDREQDSRWIAAVESLPGVLVYGRTQKEARRKVEALARQVVGAGAFDRSA